MTIRLSATVIAVKSIEKSKQFYMTLLGEKIKFDFGLNIAFESGLSLQENFPWLIKQPENSLLQKPHNMELCYEVENFEGFLHTLQNRKDITLVHQAVQYPWQQRVVRFYDLDGHIIEVGESMVSVARKLYAQGLSVEETASLTQHPVDFVITAVKR